MLTPGYSLVNGERRNIQNPRTFDIPSRERRVSLQRGDWAKIAVEPNGALSTAGKSGERFWIRITSAARLTGDIWYRGYVDNYLILGSQHGLSYQDYIHVRPEHVLDALRPGPDSPAIADEAGSAHTAS